MCPVIIRHWSLGQQHAIIICTRLRIRMCVIIETVHVQCLVHLFSHLQNDRVNKARVQKMRLVSYSGHSYNNSVFYVQFHQTVIRNVGYIPAGRVSVPDVMLRTLTNNRAVAAFQVAPQCSSNHDRCADGNWVISFLFIAPLTEHC